METFTITRCPSCRVKIKHRSAACPQACPRCKAEIAATPTISIDTSAGAARRRSAGASAATCGSFGGFLAAYYRASRWHWIIPTLIGLAAAAALSVLKPRLGGMQGLLQATILVALVGLACGFLFLVLRVFDYAVRRRRSVAASRPSWFGRIAHTSLFVVGLALPLLIAESLGPREGWLAAFVPSLALAGRSAADDPSDGAKPGSGASKPVKGSNADPLADPKNPFKVIEE